LIPDDVACYGIKKPLFIPVSYLVLLSAVSTVIDTPPGLNSIINDDDRQCQQDTYLRKKNISAECF